MAKGVSGNDATPTFDVEPKIVADRRAVAAVAFKPVFFIRKRLLFLLESKHSLRLEAGS